jgi:HCOMODA/2-hydroxy-3-carboxy-muconic semialdehyde decarboxylase
MSTSTQPTQEQQRKVRMAARALARAGLVTAFGHCSLRLNDREFLVCKGKAMALITPGDAGSVVAVDQPLPAGVLGEVRMHQAIYRARPDVQGISRFMSPQVMALSAMGLGPAARHGFSAFFYPRTPYWAGTDLIREDELATQVAATLGEAPAVVVSVNGAVTAGDSIEQSVALAWFLEDAARVELAVLAAGRGDDTVFKSAQQAASRATWSGGILERAWDYLTDGDPEK